MSDNIIIICLVLNSLVIGYLFGRFSGNNGVNTHNDIKSFFHKNQEKSITKNNLSIDDKKFVVDIKTDNLERKYDSLGDIKKTDDNISNSVNKLKNLKG